MIISVITCRSTDRGYCIMPVEEGENGIERGGSADDQVVLISTPRQPTALQKANRALGIISIEIFMFLFVLGSRLPDIPVENLLIHKVCLNEDYNYTVCDHLLSNKSYVSEKEIVQKSVSDWKIYLDLVLSGPVIFIGMMIGPWSDKFGRKLPLIIPLAGKIMTNLCLMVNIYFMHAPLAYYVVSYFPASIFGKDTDKIIVFSYVSDIVKKENRMVKFSILFFVINVAETLSSLIGTKLYDWSGYYSVILTSSVLFVAASAIAYWRIEETVKNEAPVRTKLKALFRLSIIKECFMTLIIARPGRRRAYVWLFLICDLLFILFSGNGRF